MANQRYAAAVAVASLSRVRRRCAFAGGRRRRRRPSRPRLSDVVCISTCGGVHKATAGSKVQLSGRHLRHVTQVLFERRRRRPSRGRPGRRRPAARSRSGSPTAQPPAGRRSPTPTTTAAKSPTDAEDRRRRRRSRLRAASSSKACREAAQGLLLRQEEAERDVHVHEHRARPTCGSTSSKRADGTVVDSWVEHAPGAEHGAHGELERESATTASRPPTAPTSSASAPRAGQHGVDQRGQVPYHRFEFPVRGPHSYGDGVGAPRVGPHRTRARTSSARCGTKLVAARGGRVQWKAYQAAAPATTS